MSCLTRLTYCYEMHILREREVEPRTTFESERALILTPLRRPLPAVRGYFHPRSERTLYQCMAKFPLSPTIPIITHIQLW